MNSFRHHIFCILQFISSSTSSISLCMSAYGLAKNDRKHEWPEYTVVLCIISTIIVNALKDSLTANPKIFEENKSANNNNNNNNNNDNNNNNNDNNDSENISNENLDASSIHFEKI